MLCRWRQKLAFVSQWQSKNNTECYGFSLLNHPPPPGSRVKRVIPLPRHNRTSFKFRRKSFLYAFPSASCIPPHRFRRQFTLCFICKAINLAKSVMSFSALAFSNDVMYSSRFSKGMIVQGKPPEAIIAFIRKRAIRPLPSK